MTIQQNQPRIRVLSIGLKMDLIQHFAKFRRSVGAFSHEQPREQSDRARLSQPSASSRVHEGKAGGAMPRKPPLSVLYAVETSIEGGPRRWNEGTGRCQRDHVAKMPQFSEIVASRSTWRRRMPKIYVSPDGASPGWRRQLAYGGSAGKIRDVGSYVQSSLRDPPNRPSWSQSNPVARISRCASGAAGHDGQVS